MPREYHSIHLYLSFPRREDVDFFGGGTNFLRWRETFFSPCCPSRREINCRLWQNVFFFSTSVLLFGETCFTSSFTPDGQGGSGVEERILVVLKQGRLAY